MLKTSSPPASQPSSVGRPPSLCRPSCPPFPLSASIRVHLWFQSSSSVAGHFIRVHPCPSVVPVFVVSRGSPIISSAFISVIRGQVVHILWPFVFGIRPRSFHLRPSVSICGSGFPLCQPIISSASIRVDLWFQFSSLIVVRRSFHLRNLRNLRTAIRCLVSGCP